MHADYMMRCFCLCLRLRDTRDEQLWRAAYHLDHLLCPSGNPGSTFLFMQALYHFPTGRRWVRRVRAPMREPLMCQVLGVDIGLCPYGTAQCVPSRRRGAASVADDTVLLERYDGADVSALWASLGGNNSVRIPVSF